MRATTRTFDGRIYIFLLDDLHTNVTRTNNVRELVKRFIDEYLGAMISPRWCSQAVGRNPGRS